MKNYMMFPIIALGALIQSFLPVWYAFDEVKPPVLPALVLFYSLKGSRRLMWSSALWAALLQDGLDAGPIGPALVAFPAIGSLAHRVRNEVFPEQLVTQVFLGAVGCMAMMLIMIFFYAVNGQRSITFGAGLLRLIGAGLQGMAVLPLVSLAVRKMEESLPKRRGYGWQ